MIKSLYIIGSLRNQLIPQVGIAIRKATGIEVFDDWFAAGPEADDYWRDYEKAKGRTFIEGLGGYAAQNVYNFDKRHLDRCDAAMLVMPAGKSGHLELGYVIGKGKPGFILLDPDVERWDVMYQFATGIYSDVQCMIARIREENADA